jgi:iron complex outermembrane recepter protein
LWVSGVPRNNCAIRNARALVPQYPENFNVKSLSWSVASTLAITMALCAPQAFAQDADPAASEEEIVVTGTRVANRSALETAVPVDVISSDALTEQGTTEVNQAISVAVPSFNFPRPAITDGTDSVRPATLRGLAPDQTLVLVNSKRRHSSSLVNVNGSVGRGSSAVDMNTIPSSAIGSIEVLRDGASAQYGSDAIAGVINVRLREAATGGGATLTYGRRQTSLPLPNAERDETDGETVTLGAWSGFSLGDSGFLTLSGEYRSSDRTVRAAPDRRTQLSNVNDGGPVYNPNGPINSWYGDPDQNQLTVFANAGYDVALGELYGWGSFQQRDSTSAAFFRRPGDARNVLAIYPDGFLPKINTDVTDLSGGGGLRFDLGGWDGDASVTYGKNSFDFRISDTLNRSLGAASPVSFDSGGFEYSQAVANLGFVREFEMGLASPLNVAVGLEARQENYSIRAGEPGSYITGTAGGAGGAQGFPGFQPQNQVDEDRNNVAGYIDIEANVTEQLLLSAAVRAESYSDFGETVTGKVAGRFDFTDWFGVRGAASTGFRAPSLQQSFFTATATNFISGLPVEIGTFSPTSNVAKALGARPLDAETSVNYSVGVVLDVADFTLTVDAYQINVDDRIVLSENLAGSGTAAPGTTPRLIFDLVSPFGASTARFFINGVETETRGVDIVATYGLDLSTFGDWDFTASANFNDTEVTKVPTTTVLAGFPTPPVLFDRINRLTFEDGTPEWKATLQAVGTFGDLSGTLRLNGYGETIEPGTAADGSRDIKLSPKVLVDAEGRWQVNENVNFAIGAENLLDAYPDATPLAPIDLNPTGSLSFSRYSPFGFNGRYVYARLGFAW